MEQDNAMCEKCLLAIKQGITYCFIQKYVVDHFSLQLNLCKPIPYLYKMHLSRIQLAFHNKATESGRHKNICRGERLSEFCKSSFEDEFRFVMSCPLYNNLRMKY